MINISGLYNKLCSIAKGAFEKGFLHLFSANILIYFFGFASQFFVASFLTVVQLGEIRILQTYLTFVVLFAVFGFNTSVVKLCSEERKIGEIHFLFKKANKYVTITSIVAIAVAVLLNYFNLISSDNNVQFYFYILLLSVIPQAYDGILTAYLQARRLIKEYSKINVFVKLLSVSLLILFTWRYGINGYIGIYIFGFVITYAILSLFVKKHSPSEQISVPSAFSDHFRLAIIALLTNLLGQFFNYFDIFFLNYFIDDREAIGYYSFAITLTLGMMIYRTTVNQLVVPYLSKMSGDISALENRALTYGKLNSLSSVIIAIGFITCIPFLVPLFYGDKFSNSMPFFFVLCISEMFYNINSFKGYTILAIGEIKYNLFGSIINGIINILLSVIGLYLYGLMGLAFGKMISNFVYCIIVKYIYKIAVNNFRNK